MSVLYPFRIGEGYDLHRIIEVPAEGRKLVLGGAVIPWDRCLDGHSDADVLIHAIMNSVLGAAALGDIGRHFPDSDPEYKNIDSMILAAKTNLMVRSLGYEIGNIDATVEAQEPKLSRYIPEMIKNIAGVFRIDQDQVNVKATTGEHIGVIGRGEGIAARAVCLLYKSGVSSGRTVLL